MAKSLRRSLYWGGVVASVGLLWGGTAIAAEPKQSNSTGLGERLSQMFSPEIQSTLSACTAQGGVDLAASVSNTNSLACGDGSTVEVSYASYLDTTSNFFAASLLLGMSAAAVDEPRITPGAVGQFLTSDGSDVIRQGLQRAIADSPFISSSPASVDLLVEAIVQRATDTLDNLDRFTTLLGTPEQSNLVVTSFCTPPGMSATEAQTAVPELSLVQLYAICLHQAGLSGETVSSGS